jgi:hypothetical protein
MNNIKFNIFNANAAALKSSKFGLNVTAKKSAKVLGRKIENQTTINASDSSLTDRTKKICIKSRNKSYLTSRLSKRQQRSSLLRRESRISLKRVRSETKKRNQETPKTSRVCIPISTCRTSERKIKLGADKSFANSIRNSECKHISIPYSNNRFQGKYNEVIPAKYAQMIIVLKQERHNKELKKQEEKEKIKKMKLESEKIRMANNKLLNKNSGTSVTVRKLDTPRTKTKRKSLDGRLKEMGMEFIIRLRQSETRTLIYSLSIYNIHNFQSTSFEENWHVK